MKTPEKIYISTNSKDGTYYISNQYKRLIEYTRTDAFIEKAYTFIRERLVFDDTAWYIGGEVTLKDKVIEDFKNYMKGE